MYVKSTAPASLTSAVPLTDSGSPFAAVSMTTIETLGSRWMLRTLTRSPRLPILNRPSSYMYQTGVDCGEPSRLTVDRMASSG